jgi:hypothetical protein
MAAPKAPDYSSIIALFQQAASYAYNQSQSQQDWAKSAYNDNKKVSDIVIDKALGALDKQTAWANADRKRYEDIYQPLEDQAAKRAQDYASPERQEVEAGKAEADVAAQFQQARQTAQDRLEQYGVDPSNTRANALDFGSRIAEAAAQAGAGNTARFRTEQYGDQLMREAINVGRGYPAQATGEQSGAGQSANQATNTGLATTASGGQTMGTGQSWAGAGNSAAGAWGNTLNTGFSNQLNSWKANQDSSSGWGSALGLAGSIASKFLLEDGGVIPEYADGGTAVPPEASPSNGAIPDDVPAQIDGQAPARLNAGEFVIPKDVVGWLGEKGMQQIILKARKEMSNGNGERPAQPEMGPPPPTDGAGAIPMPQGV